MAVIEVEQLVKVFRTYKRREGVWGSVRDLIHRRYEDLRAVDGISFTVQAGELIGYIGPNGAGKSTSIKMLTGILRPTSGRMSVLGLHPFHDRKNYTRRIGVVFGQRTQLWWDIATIESFRLLGRIYDVERAEVSKRLDMLDEILGLRELFHLPLRKLSLGQRIRCDIAASLLHRPEILFLDEPTIGLDAVSKDGIRGFLRRINRELKTTIILTTHDLREIEELCRRMIILDKGKIIYDGALSKVRSLPGLRRRIVIDFPGDAPLDELSARFAPSIRFQRESDRRITGAFDPQELSAVEIIKEIVTNHDVADIALAEPSLEEVVMKIYRDGLVT